MAIIFFFWGYGQTDRHGFGILTWKHVGTQKISTQSSKLVVSRRSLYASPEDGDSLKLTDCAKNFRQSFLHPLATFPHCDIRFRKK